MSPLEVFHASSNYFLRHLYHISICISFFLQQGPAKPFSLNIGSKADPHKVQVLEKEKVFILAAQGSKTNETSEMYMLKGLKELINVKSLNAPFTVIIPLKTSSHYWSVVTLNFEKTSMKFDVFVTHSKPKIKEELQRRVEKIQNLKGFNEALKKNLQGLNAFTRGCHQGVSSESLLAQFRSHGYQMDKRAKASLLH